MAEPQPRLNRRREAKLTNAQRLAIFRACVLRIGNPELVERKGKYERDTYLPLFRSIINDGAPTYWQATIAFGGAVLAVRVSVLWNQYRDWYKNDFAAG